MCVVALVPILNQSIILLSKSKGIAVEAENCLVFLIHFVYTFEGIVTNIYQDESGNYLVDGDHTKSSGDGKRTSYKDYNYHFKNIPMTEVRVAPSALDTMI